jgi:hypothetical protein
MIPLHYVRVWLGFFLICVGIKPTKLALVSFESTSLDHSGKVSLENDGIYIYIYIYNHEVLYTGRSIYIHGWRRVFNMTPYAASR